MTASYPSDSQIQTWSQTYGMPVDNVYTYAAANDSLPSNGNVLAAWINQLDGGFAVGAPQGDINAYVQQHRGPARGDATTWFQQQGMMDASGNWTSASLPVGYFYDQATGASSGAVATSAPSSPSGGFDHVSAVVGAVSESISSHPIMWGGVAVLVVGGYLLWRHRR